MTHGDITALPSPRPSFVLVDVEGAGPVGRWPSLHEAQAAVRRDLRDRGHHGSVQFTDEASGALLADWPAARSVRAPKMGVHEATDNCHCGTHNRPHGLT